MITGKESAVGGRGEGSRPTTVPPERTEGKAWKTNQSKERAKGQPDLNHSHPLEEGSQVSQSTSASAAEYTGPCCWPPQPRSSGPGTPHWPHGTAAPRTWRLLWGAFSARSLVQGQEWGNLTVPAQIVCLISGYERSQESKHLDFKPLSCPQQGLS